MSESKDIASRRKTSNSRGPGQEGTVRLKHHGLIVCQDCGRMMNGTVAQGLHSPHMRDGVRVNCRGVAI